MIKQAAKKKQVKGRYPNRSKVDLSKKGKLLYFTHDCVEQHAKKRAKDSTIQPFKLFAENIVERAVRSL